MQWALLAIPVIALLILSRYFPKTAFSILGVLLVGVGIIVLSTTEMGERSRSGISPASVRIENWVLTEAYGGSYRFNGRLVNTHETLVAREATLSVTMLDCPETGNCAIIGQQEKRVTRKIPAGQARDVSTTLTFDSARPGGELRWEVRITQIRS